MLRTILLSLAIGATGALAHGQGSSFSDASATTQRDLEAAIAELNALREEIAADTLPRSRELSELEARLTALRSEHQSATREVDTRILELNNLRTRRKALEEEGTYLSNLLAEYLRNFESRLHIAELQRYRDSIEAAKLAGEDPALARADVYAGQAGMLSLSLDRLEEALGGTRFDGTAVNTDSLVMPGTFVVVGPAALFRSGDGAVVGTVEQRLGSLEPTVMPFGTPDDSTAAAAVVTSSAGSFPLDPTLGSAHKVESTEETLLEHIRKGGPVMYPILALAALSLLVALAKWVALLFVRKPSQKRVRSLVAAVAKEDRDAAMRQAKRVRGPTGRMMVTGVEHLGEPSEVIEEVMYEHVLTTRLKLQRFLPFIAVCAAAAPLLGLLGTVTGIINTFKLITVFGSGDVKMLSGGISEALITTEFGLIVAIPSLLLHALLSRKARSVIDRMEIAAMGFVNQVAKNETRRAAAGAARPPVSPPERGASGDAAPPEPVRPVRPSTHDGHGTRPAPAAPAPATA